MSAQEIADEERNKLHNLNIRNREKSKRKFLMKLQEKYKDK